MISPASALSGTGNVSYAYRPRTSTGTSPSAVSVTDVLFPASMQSVQLSSTQCFSLGAISTDDTFAIEESVGFYVSYYFEILNTSSELTIIGDPSNSSAYSCIYYNSAGTQGTVIGGPTVTNFTPASSSSTVTPGITLKCNFEGSSELPINRLSITCDYTNNFFIYPNTTASKNLVITSASIVEVGSSEELQALQGLANQIAAQSQILSAMYGDIMEVLNAIYSRLGDMQETMNLANSYFNSMVSYLNSINTNTSQIYSLLQSQFQLLIAAINTASSDIQGAISKQTEDLKTYFDSVFNSAVGTLPDDTDSAQGVIDDAHENDEQYTADALGKFEEISATFQGFDGSVGSGVAVASTLFSRVWTAMGDYVIVYTFPLTLALALVIVGRLSRVHSKDSSKSKGGDDSG